MTTPPVCNYEGSDYQTSFWERGGRAYEDACEAVALRRLLPKTGKLLLELGAGAGRNTLRYQGFERVILLDYSHTQLEQARRHLGDSHRFVYVAANIYTLPIAAGLCDAATMIRTLHHMAEPSQALHQVRQSLAPGAVFILEYANKQNLKAILRFAFRRQIWSPFTPEPVEFAALNFDFHPGSIRHYLRANDFLIQRQLTVSHYRAIIFKRFFPLGLLIKMDSLAQLTGDWWQLSPSVFVRAEATGQGPSHEPNTFFRCPVCGHGLPESSTDLTCSQCGKVWPYQDGIYDFKENNA